MGQKARAFGGHRPAAAHQTGAGPHGTGHPHRPYGGAQQTAAVARPGAPGDFSDRRLHQPDRRPLGPQPHAPGAHARADRGQRRDLLSPGQSGAGPRPHRDPLQQRMGGAPGRAGQEEATAETSCREASLVLGPARTEIRYNSEWSEPLGAQGMIRLAAMYTVARMMEREDFHKRYTTGQSISVHEFLYPLMQGYDSVALKSDLELGGTDQKFNLLMGRHLQHEHGQEPQCVLTMPLLVGLDGVDKMSKSKNNYIAITESANTMYAKLLSIPDTLMWDWYPLLSWRSLAGIAA